MAAGAGGATPDETGATPLSMAVTAKPASAHNDARRYLFTQKYNDQSSPIIVQPTPLFFPNSRLCEVGLLKLYVKLTRESRFYFKQVAPGLPFGARLT